MLYKRSCIFILPLLAFASQAFGWGSMYSTNPVVVPAKYGEVLGRKIEISACFTNFGPFDIRQHRYVDMEAHKLLEADPAYVPGSFPATNQVSIYGEIDGDLKGEGPDAKGATPYSWHYYNYEQPEGKRGLAPEKSALFFRQLAEGISASINPPPAADLYAKPAAWASHFLADMYVPYHTIGGPSADFQKYKVGDTSPISLDELVKGPMIPGTTPPRPRLAGGSAYTNEFRTDVDLFLISTQGDSSVDWFDPWYWDWTNNVPEWREQQFCSHLFWEGGSGMNPPNVSIPPADNNPYEPAWKNPAMPSLFEPPLDQQAEAAKTMAEKVAKRTRDKLKEAVRVGDSERRESIGESIRGVYTLWRASISAMKPEIKVKNGTTDAGKACLEVIAIFSNMATNDSAGSVRAKILVEGAGTLIDGKDEVNIGDIGPGKSKTNNLWKIQTDDPTNCLVTVKMIGEFKKTPDLQYAAIVTNLTPTAVALRLPHAVRDAYAGESYSLTAGVPARRMPRQPLFVWVFNDGTQQIRTENNRVSHVFPMAGQYYIVVYLYDKTSGDRMGAGTVVALVSPAEMEKEQRAVNSQLQSMQETAFLNIINGFPGDDLEERFQAYCLANAKLVPATRPFDTEAMVKSSMDDARTRYYEEHNEEMPEAAAQVYERAIRQQIQIMIDAYREPPMNLYKSDPKPQKSGPPEIRAMLNAVSTPVTPKSVTDSSDGQGQAPRHQTESGGKNITPLQKDDSEKQAGPAQPITPPIPVPANEETQQKAMPASEKQPAAPQPEQKNIIQSKPLEKPAPSKSKFQQWKEDQDRKMKDFMNRK